MCPIFKSIFSGNFPNASIFPSVPFIAQDILLQNLKVSLLSLLVTLGLTLTPVNVGRKSGFFSLSILVYSVPPDKKLIEISFAIHH